MTTQSCLLCNHCIWCHNENIMICEEGDPSFPVRCESFDEIKIKEINNNINNFQFDK